MYRNLEVFIQFIHSGNKGDLSVIRVCEDEYFWHFHGRKLEDSPQVDVEAH